MTFKERILDMWKYIQTGDDSYPRWQRVLHIIFWIVTWPLAYVYQNRYRWKRGIRKYVVELFDPKLSPNFAPLLLVTAGATIGLVMTQLIQGAGI